MEIIKHGNLVKQSFKCRFCGCEFVCEPGEYDRTYLAGDEELGAKDEYVIDTTTCPECGNRVINEQF